MRQAKTNRLSVGAITTLVMGIIAGCFVLFNLSIVLSATSDTASPRRVTTESFLRTTTRLDTEITTTPAPPLPIAESSSPKPLTASTTVPVTAADQQLVAVGDEPVDVPEREATSDWATLDSGETQVVYPANLSTSPLAVPIPKHELTHANLLHDACVHSDTVLPWTYGRGGVVASPNGAFEANASVAALLEELRQCPDVDIYLPGHLRGHGYCEDGVAYLKGLESRFLPRWVLDMQFPGNVTYHDLCPSTPMLLLQHYWDGLPDHASWPSDKPIYWMPNIEMVEVTPTLLWRVDVVLCKTLQCALRIRQWFGQYGNPRHAQVMYTRHTSTDLANVASLNTSTVSAKKDFANVRFVHVVGGSNDKGTRELLFCWASTLRLPPLHVYVHPQMYRHYRQAFALAAVAAPTRANVHVGELSTVDMANVYAASAFFVCASKQEGYGHYLNQARATGAVIVTTDHPPMNELVSSTSGVLVRARPSTRGDQLLGGDYSGEFGLKDVQGLSAELGVGAVCEAVERVMQMTMEERQRMAQEAQQRYYVDTRFFLDKMQRVREFARTHTRTQL